MNDMSKLNWEQLQQALYEGLRDLRHQDASKRKEAVATVRAVYEEYERRGATNIARPDVLIEQPGQ